jgi:hypothetical protein
VDVGLDDDRPEGPVDPPARLEEAGQERGHPELRDAQLDVAGLGREEPALRLSLRWVVRSSVRSYREAPIAWLASSSMSSWRTSAIA